MSQAFYFGNSVCLNNDCRSEVSSIFFEGRSIRQSFDNRCLDLIARESAEFMQQWMESLYREHRQGLFTYALSILGCQQSAEDAIQNAFARLHGGSNLADEMEPEKMVPYVFRCVRNCAIDLQRTQQRQRRLGESLFETVRQIDNNPSPPDLLLTEERAEMLRSVIDGLAELEREVVVLKVFAGLTFEQAGEMAQTSPKTMATRYRRALVKLENQLKGQL